MSEAPKRIWLEPFCEDAEVAWCEHQLEDCDECGEKAVEYILAAEHDRIIAEKDAEIARLSPIPPHVAAARVVKVKPLVWIDRNGFWRAVSAIEGVYEILEVSGTYHLSRIVHGHGSSMKPCPTLESAKAAAQADYEARIRGALADQENSDD